ncbi:MAG: LVIVD repeat-containing protein [Tenuifilaceae bacterium]
MKTHLKTFLSVFVLAVVIGGCTDNTTERITYTANVPVYMPYSEFRSSFKKSEPKDSISPGKIYFKDNYLFVNEPGKGIHIIDNSNPSNPQKVAFYEIMGNVDLAIKGDILYADSYIDLLAINISDINNPREVGRLKNIFPEIVPMGNINFLYANVDHKKGVIINWEVKTITEEYNKDQFGGWYYRGNMDFLAFTNSTEGGGWSAGAGIGGSMARFMLNNQYLYVIAVPTRLKSVDISIPNAMNVVDSINVFRNMETLFKHNNNLFIGTTTGMLIYDIATPEKPQMISEYNHITACDPVVVDGKYAYVTLRTGNMCANGQNLLDVIDISSIANPYLVKSYPLFNPHGLGIDGDLLFICDGAAGLKVYNKHDPMAILTNQVAHFPDFDTYDVIPFEGVLMLVGKGGIYQYSYTNLGNLTLLSHIPVISK